MPTLPLAGEWTLGSFCAHVGALDLCPEAPACELPRNFRQWALEGGGRHLASELRTEIACRRELGVGPVVLSGDQVRRFGEDGYLVVPCVVPENLLAAVGRRLTLNLRLAPGLYRLTVRAYLDRNRLSRPARRYLRVLG